MKRINLQHIPCNVNKIIHKIVITLTIFSNNLTKRHKFVITAKVILNPSITFTYIWLGWNSIVSCWALVRMYQWSASPGIANNIEKGTKILDIRGRDRILTALLLLLLLLFWLGGCRRCSGGAGLGALRLRSCRTDELLCVVLIFSPLTLSRELDGGKGAIKSGDCLGSDSWRRLYWFGRNDRQGTNIEKTVRKTMITVRWWVPRIIHGVIVEKKCSEGIVVRGNPGLERWGYPLGWWAGERVGNRKLTRVAFQAFYVGITWANIPI